MSRLQFRCTILILRHAWLNLWDKHMTTGRINQVAAERVCGFGFASLRPIFCFGSQLRGLVPKVQKTPEAFWFFLSCGVVSASSHKFRTCHPLSPRQPPSEPSLGNCDPVGSGSGELGDSVHRFCEAFWLKDASRVLCCARRARLSRKTPNHWLRFVLENSKYRVQIRGLQKPSIRTTKSCFTKCWVSAKL